MLNIKWIGQVTYWWKLDDLTTILALRSEWNTWNTCTMPCTKSNIDVACRNVSQPLIEWRLIVLFLHWITLRMQLTVHPVFEQHKSLLSCEHMALQRVVCQYEARTWGEYYQHSEINGINERYSLLPVSLCNPKSITVQFCVSWWMHHYTGCCPVNAATLRVLYAALCKQPGVVFLWL